MMLDCLRWWWCWWCWWCWWWCWWRWWCCWTVGADGYCIQPMLLNHCTMDPNPERRSQNTLWSAAALLPQLQLNVTPLSKTHPSLIQRLEVCIKKRTLALWQIQQCIFLTQLSGWLGDGGHLTLQQLQLNSESGNAAISNQARVLKRQSCGKHSAVRCLWAEQSTAFKSTIVQLGILWL